ncbi:hypothetical protein BDZ94DRAFT_1309435 [Collybia nuda]|uniref:NAD(P)-binding domain-containing protein n=1 Tax=Collybia nuda TaxID=64659 RepID=A0A9P5Y3D7_9AGAR|nr:hypothetical protein BDZ94DRAFT_1309435 [Collybia nuda]
MIQNVLVIGGSRNIGYFSAVRFLDAGATVTFLLRSPSVFDKDMVIQGHVKAGKAHIVKGDALTESGVQQSWNKAGKHGNIDLLLFTVGVTRASHTALPLLLKPVDGYLLAVPHKDKVGAERVISHCAGWTWKSSEDGEPDENTMGPGDWTQRSGLPVAGTLKQVLVIRPALLTDGECAAEGSGKSYRVSDGELKGWTVSRKDVAHFVVDAALNRWREFENKVVSIAY